MSALNPNATHSQPNDPTLFLLIRKLIITNRCFQVEACRELAITFLPKIIWMVITPENIQTYIPSLFRFPAFKKSQYEQSENDGQVIISEKEKHKININQM